MTDPDSALHPEVPGVIRLLNSSEGTHGSEVGGADVVAEGDPLVVSLTAYEDHA